MRSPLPVSSDARATAAAESASAAANTAFASSREGRGSVLMHRAAYDTSPPHKTQTRTLNHVQTSARQEAAPSSPLLASFVAAAERARAAHSSRPSKDEEASPCVPYVSSVYCSPSSR